jgi:transposase-like protein
MRAFECPECGAEYGVLELAGPTGARPKFHCLNCGSPFPDSNGPRLQYTLLKRPSEETLEDLQG